MPVPMIDDLPLEAVQFIRQESDQELVQQKIAGLDGTLHQKLGRGSHRVFVGGVLLPGSAAGDLQRLQTMAAAGEEVTFTADITTALSIDKMVIEAFSAEQHIGPAGQIAYAITLAESPALPAAAEVGGFGGLDAFGTGADLGFDAAALGSVLADVSSQAGAVLAAADKLAAAVDQIQALAKLADLRDLGNPVKPVADTAPRVAAAAAKLSDVGVLVDALVAEGQPS
jgi:phage protein U